MPGSRPPQDFRLPKKWQGFAGRDRNSFKLVSWKNYHFIVRLFINNEPNCIVSYFLIISTLPEKYPF